MKTNQEGALSMKELMRTYETEEFFATAALLYDHLASSELPAYRILARHDIQDYESPLHMPDAINKYREVGVPISKITASAEITDEHTSWVVDVDLSITNGDFKKSFCILPDEHGGYVITENGTILTPISDEDLNRMLVDLTISRHERQQNLVDNRPLQFDVTAPVSARLISQCLKRRPGVISSTTAYYDMSQHVTIPQDVEFVVQTNSKGESYRIDVKEQKEYEYATHSAHYGATLSIDHSDIENPQYSLSAEGIRMLDIGNGKQLQDDEPSEEAIIPFALAHLNHLCNILGADLPKVIASTPEAIRWNEKYT